MIQGILFLPSNNSRSTMKQYSLSLCLNNFLLMRTRPAVDWGFYGHCKDLKDVCLCRQTKQMTFWETGVGLWSTAHFVYNSCRSRVGAQGTPTPLFLDQPSPPPSYLITCASKVFACLVVLVAGTSYGILSLKIFD